jgi:hypothetical protein
MTLAEGEAVFGRPADGKDGPSPAPPVDDFGDWLKIKEPCAIRMWFGRELAAIVSFDADDQVVWKGAVNNEPEPWYRRLAAWGGL